MFWGGGLFYFVFSIYSHSCTVFVCPRFIVCQLYYQPDVWQLHLWRWPVPRAGRHSPVWASLPGLRLDCPLLGQRSPGHCTQTCFGASHPLSSVSMYCIHTQTQDKKPRKHTEHYALLNKWLGLLTILFIPYVYHPPRWFLKSGVESFLVGDGKPACNFPLHFGKCVF